MFSHQGPIGRRKLGESHASAFGKPPTVPGTRGMSHDGSMVNIGTVEDEVNMGSRAALISPDIELPAITPGQKSVTAPMTKPQSREQQTRASTCFDDVIKARLSAKIPRNLSYRKLDTATEHEQE